jgi:hypothetical protein
MRHIYYQLALQADNFGVCLIGNGATVERMPLVNVLATGVHEPACCRLLNAQGTLKVVAKSMQYLLLISS